MRILWDKISHLQCCFKKEKKKKKEMIVRPLNCLSSEPKKKKNGVVVYICERKIIEINLDKFGDPVNYLLEDGGFCLIG